MPNAVTDRRRNGGMLSIPSGLEGGRRDTKKTKNTKEKKPGKATRYIPTPPKTLSQESSSGEAEGEEGAGMRRGRRRNRTKRRMGG